MGEPKERPILFSAPMIKAILGGTKTQTRRVVKWPATLSGSFEHLRTDATAIINDGRKPIGLSWPYGQPGDRLWVRETFSPFVDSSIPARIDAASYVVLTDGTQVYRRDGAIVPGLSSYAPGAFDHVRWRPSIHMPRWASRITLEVTSVRVERLQDITEEDARAEGVEACGGFMATSGCWMNYGLDGPALSTARDSFSSLWSSINGPESWDANPFVWVVGFRRGGA